jgi:hypothetical protein
MFSACLLAVVLVVGAGLLTGAVPLSNGHNSARPPCEQLPDRQAIVDAVASHEDLVTRIQEVGPGVKVDVATPCEDQPDRAIVRITYATDAEWEGVDSILGQEGFGVAAELVSDSD